jgi:hypothetical protein
MAALRPLEGVALVGSASAISMMTANGEGDTIIHSSAFLRTGCRSRKARINPKSKLMLKSDREARLQRAKALGRIAYVLLRASKIEGVLEYDGEDKYLRKFDYDWLFIELLTPFRAGAQPTEYSSIEIRHGRLKVFEIRWDKAGSFKIVTFKPGEWERTLRAAAQISKTS